MHRFGEADEKKRCSARVRVAEIYGLAAYYGNFTVRCLFLRSGAAGLISLGIKIIIISRPSRKLPACLSFSRYDFGTVAFRASIHSPGVQDPACEPRAVFTAVSQSRRATSFTDNVENSRRSIHGANLARLVTIVESPNASLRSAQLRPSRVTLTDHFLSSLSYSRGLSRFIATDPARRYTRPWIAKTISMYLASAALRVIAADRSFGVDRRPRENLARRKRANARSQRCVRRDAASRRVTSRHVTSRHVTSGSVEWIGRNESRIRLPVRARPTIAINRRSIGRHVTHVRESKPGSQVFLRSRVQRPAAD